VLLVQHDQTLRGPGEKEADGCRHQQRAGLCAVPWPSAFPDPEPLSIAETA